MKSVSNKINFPELESRILEFWRKENIFRKSVEERPADNEFIFYDGPPFATGLPHYGHLLAGTIKDVIPRYKTMQGYRERDALDGIAMGCQLNTRLSRPWV